MQGEHHGGRHSPFTVAQHMHCERRKLISDNPLSELDGSLYNVAMSHLLSTIPAYGLPVGGSALGLPAQFIRPYEVFGSCYEWMEEPDREALYNNLLYAYAIPNNTALSIGTRMQGRVLIQRLSSYISEEYTKYRKREMIRGNIHSVMPKVFDATVLLSGQPQLGNWFQGLSRGGCDVFNTRFAGHA